MSSHFCSSFGFWSAIWETAISDVRLGLAAGLQLKASRNETRGHWEAPMTSPKRPRNVSGTYRVGGRLYTSPAGSSVHVYRGVVCTRLLAFRYSSCYQGKWSCHVILLWQAQYLVTLDLFRVVFVLAGALVGAAARSLGMAAPWQVHGNRTVLLLLWQAQYLVTLDLFRVVFVLAGALVGAAARSLGIAAPWQVHGNLWTVLLLLSQSFEYGRPRKFASRIGR